MTAILKSALRALGMVIIIASTKAHSSGLKPDFILRPSGYLSALPSLGTQLSDEFASTLIVSERARDRGRPSGRRFKVEWNGERGEMIERTVSPTGLQCGFFGAISRAEAHGMIRSSSNNAVHSAVIHTLWMSYGAANKRTDLENYLKQTLGLTFGEEDFKELLIQDQKLYLAVLKYFFEHDQGQLTFHPGMMGLLDALAHGSRAKGSLGCSRRSRRDSTFIGS